jgi:bacteriocin-like protein
MKRLNTEELKEIIGGHGTHVECAPGEGSVCTIEDDILVLCYCIP